MSSQLIVAINHLASYQTLQLIIYNFFQFKILTCKKEEAFRLPPYTYNKTPVLLYYNLNLILRLFTSYL